MKNWHRLFVLVTVVTLVLGALPLSVFAAPTSPAAPVVGELLCLRAQGGIHANHCGKVVDYAESPKLFGGKTYLVRLQYSDKSLYFWMGDLRLPKKGEVQTVY